MYCEKCLLTLKTNYVLRIIDQMRGKVQHGKLFLEISIKESKAVRWV